MTNEKTIAYYTAYRLSLIHILELIVEQVHRKKGKLVTSGMGKAGQIALSLIHI